MSQEPTPGDTIGKQDRQTIIGEVTTPLALTALVVLVAEGLFGFVIQQGFVPPEHRIWVILCIVVLLLALVFMAWLSVRKDFYFTIIVSRREARRAVSPVRGAKVKLVKNGKEIRIEETSSQGEATFSLPIGMKDAIKIKVSVDDKERDMYLVRHGLQQRFDVEFVD